MSRREGGPHQHAAFVFRDDSIDNSAKRINKPLVGALLPVLQCNDDLLATATSTVNGARRSGAGVQSFVGAHTDRRCHEEA